MKALWITDRWASLDHTKDTSLRLMEESIKKKWECWWCSSSDVSLHSDGKKVKVLARADQLLSVEAGRPSSGFKWGESKIIEIAKFDQIHLRVDPPVDHRYIHLVQVLQTGLSHKNATKLVNPALSLYQLNEKIAAYLEPSLAPKGTVAAEWETLLKTGQELKTAVSKPLHQAQSKGVEKVSFAEIEDLEKSRKELAFATGQFSQLIMLQEFLNKIEMGETRLWFVDQKLIACAKKIPVPGEFKIDMDRGSTVQKHSLTATEKKQIPKIAKILKQFRVRLAAIDLIDAKVSDFNITSPGLIVQMEEALGQNLAGEIISRLSKKNKR